MPIEVVPAEIAASGAVAADLAALLRSAMDRLQAAGSVGVPSAVGAAWSAMWTALRSAALDVATAGEDLATMSRAAAAAIADTEAGLMPDAH